MQIHNIPQINIVEFPIEYINYILLLTQLHVFIHTFIIIGINRYVIVSRNVIK